MCLRNRLRQNHVRMLLWRLLELPKLGRRLLLLPSKSRSIKSVMQGRHDLVRPSFSISALINSRVVVAVGVISSVYRYNTLSIGYGTTYCIEFHERLGHVLWQRLLRRVRECIGIGESSNWTLSLSNRLDWRHGSWTTTTHGIES